MKTLLALAFLASSVFVLPIKASPARSLRVADGASSPAAGPRTLIPHYLIYDTATESNNVSASAWTARCHAFFALTADAYMSDPRWRMYIVMGNVVDHYRPVEGSNICQMLVSDNLHEFSPSGLAPWYKPTKHYNFHLGGSSDGWPRTNIPFDDRRYLSFWGQGLGYGSNGCCHNDYIGTAASTPAWGKAFKMYFWLSHEVPPPETTTSAPRTFLPPITDPRALATENGVNA